MTGRERSGTGLFMTELILVIMFFSIAAACCLQVFGKAAAINRRSELVREMVTAAENIVQLLEYDPEGKELERVYPQLRKQDHEAEISFNRNNENCEASDAWYTITLQPVSVKGTEGLGITGTDQRGECCYELKVILMYGGEWD